MATRLRWTSLRSPLVTGPLVAALATIALVWRINSSAPPEHTAATYRSAAPDLTVAFVSDRAGGRSVWVQQGTNTPRQISRPGLQAHSPQWSPSGKELAYATARDENHFEVIVRNWSDGQERVAFQHDGPIGNVSWSPTDDALLIDRITESGAERSQELVTVALTGGPPRVITRSEPPALGQASWRAGHDRPIVIARVSDKSESHLEFYQEDDTLDVVWADTNDFSPAWSPNGSRLAFVRAEPGSGWTLMVSAPDGSDGRAITHSPRLMFKPSWSADGRQLVYERYDSTNGTLWVAPTDGSGRERVLFGGSDSQTSPSVRPAQ